MASFLLVEGAIISGGSEKLTPETFIQVLNASGRFWSNWTMPQRNGILSLWSHCMVELPEGRVGHLFWPWWTRQWSNKLLKFQCSFLIGSDAEYFTGFYFIPLWLNPLFFFNENFALSKVMFNQFSIKLYDISFFNCTVHLRQRLVPRPR